MSNVLCDDGLHAIQYFSKSDRVICSRCEKEWLPKEECTEERDENGIRKCPCNEWARKMLKYNKISTVDQKLEKWIDFGSSGSSYTDKDCCNPDARIFCDKHVPYGEEERETPEKILGKYQVYDLDSICRDLRWHEGEIMDLKADTYSREEIDERMEAIIEYLSFHINARGAEKLRKRFLS